MSVLSENQSYSFRDFSKLPKAVFIGSAEGTAAPRRAPGTSDTVASVSEVLRGYNWRSQL